MRRLFAIAAVLAVAACARAPAPVHFFAEGQPQSLADWHVVDVRDGRLVPNDGVLPYDLATPLFTDYAHKLRTVWMPKGTSARYGEADFDYPVGTILSKTFYYPVPETGRGEGDTVLRSSDAGFDPRGLELAKVRLIETRLLVRRKDGWLALPYVWNAQQTEATLKRGGELVALTLVGADGSREQADYAVPDQNQCAGCHGDDMKTRKLHPLGPKARHLNRDFAYADGTANQLARWTQVGYLTGASAPAAAPRNADWLDASQPLDARARLPRHQLRSLPQPEGAGQHLRPVAGRGDAGTAAAWPLQAADRGGQGHRRLQPRHRPRPAGCLDPHLSHGQRGSRGDDAGAGPQRRP